MILECGVSPNKWHKLCYELSIALEATFPAEVEPCFLEEFSFPELIYNNPGGNFWRANYPAITEGNLDDGSLSVNFISWVGGTKEDDRPEYYRLCLRIKPLSKKTSQTRSVVFARFDEKETFTFDSSRNGGNFINLTFFGFGKTEFQPLYLRVEENSGHFGYYVISATFEDEKIVAKITKTSKETVPSHLKK